MFESGAPKLIVALVLVLLSVVAAAELLANRRIRGRALTRVEAQAAGALVGLAIGSGFLYASG